MSKRLISGGISVWGFGPLDRYQIARSVKRGDEVDGPVVAKVLLTA
jgi:hypothetical protein